MARTPCADRSISHPRDAARRYLRAVHGEFELIALLRERIDAAGAGRGGRVVRASGDDAAVSLPGGATATSVDAIVDGVHFRRATFPPPAIGAKALAAALSDLAAMGAEPGEAYVQLGLPSDASSDELAGIADGLGALAASAGVVVAGGDVVRSPVLFLALSVVGHAESPERFVSRAGARPGDALLVTGPLGGAAAGLLLLEGAVAPGVVPEAERQALVARQLEPRPRLTAGAALARAGATALIDLSDGLAGDARHVARASGVRLVIEAPDVPEEPGVAAVARAAGVDPAELLLGGGEDYELLAALPPDRIAATIGELRAQGLDPARVGRVEAGEDVVLLDASARELDVRGFDQLRSPTRAAPT